MIIRSGFFRLVNIRARLCGLVRCIETVDGHTGGHRPGFGSYFSSTGWGAFPVRDSHYSNAGLMRTGFGRHRDGGEISDHQQSWGYEDDPWKGPGPPLLVAADLSQFINRRYRSGLHPPSMPSR